MYKTIDIDVDDDECQANLKKLLAALYKKFDRIMVKTCLPK